MKIIGLNFLHADSSCCLIINNKIISAVEEERFTRIKHFSGFPGHSLKYCLQNSNLKMDDIDYFCINFDKKYNFLNKLFYIFTNISILIKIITNKFYRNLVFSKIIRNSNVLEYFAKFNIPKKKIIFVEHHLSHVSSAYLSSGFLNSIVFSFDGTGDFSTIEIYKCQNKNYKLLYKQCFPNSLGLFYQMITQYLGFKNFGDEFKVMSLASFGNTSYVEKILQIFDIDKENNFKIKTKYFNSLDCLFNNDFLTFNNFYTKEFENLFNFPPRKKNDKINDHHRNLAHSAQFVFSLIAMNILRKYKNYSENLCLTGGCAFNSVFAENIKKSQIFKKVFITSNSGDAGGAVGAAKFVNLKKNKNFKNTLDTNPFLGPNYSDLYIKKLLDSKDMKNIFKKNNFYYKKYSIKKIISIASRKLYTNEIIFWFRGRSEFGPRALGNRSILASPLNSRIKDKINFQIKEREFFRPFAPSVIEVFKDKYFYTHNDMFGLMNFVVKAKEKKIKYIPATVHIDGTSRAQVVSKKFNKDFYLLIKEFGKLSSHPVLLNTSFNIQEPIVNSPEDAINTFKKSKIKNLFLNNYHIYKI
jgi:carbamoyltransferase